MAAFDTPFTVSLVIFLAVYALIVSERLHRSVAAMVGAVLMFAAGVAFGFLSFERVTTEFVDWNTIGLLLGMMVIVGVMVPTGAFEYLAIRALKAARGDLFRVLLYLSVATAVVSAFLDNVTTILLFVPVTLTVCRTLEVRPMPFLLAEIFASNVGGTATLIGDPPNILIGSQVREASFDQFLLHLGPIIVVVFLVGALMLRWRFGPSLKGPMRHPDEIAALDPRREIKDLPLLKKCLAVLAGVIGLFLLQGTLGIESSIPALGGAAVLLAITRLQPEKALAHVEWPTLMFFVSLFVVVGGIESTGVITWVAGGVAGLSGGSLFAAVLLVLWVSAFASAFVDNIPFVAAMIPLVQYLVLAPGLEWAGAVHPLWWALSLGACLGGNGTLVGASANIVGAGLAEREGFKITFVEFLKEGMPFMIVTTAAGSLMLLMSVFVLGF